MTSKEQILKEIEQVPESRFGEILDFIQFLKTKEAQEKLGITIISESSLKKDWLSPEEDEAWRNL